MLSGEDFQEKAEHVTTFDALTRLLEMSALHRTTVNRRQCGVGPCRRRLRIRVRDVPDLLAAGASRDEIPMKTEDIPAAPEYAVRQSDHAALRVALIRRARHRRP
jgi:uncharacterized protein (DUF433 family)